MTALKKDDMKNICRMHFILHTHAKATVADMVPVLTLVAVVLLVMSVYPFIALFDVLDTVVLFNFGVIISAETYMLALLTEGAYDITIQSKKYAEVFEEKLGKNYQKVDKKFFDSVQSMVWSVGSFAEIDKAFFPEFMNFVTETVIDLLLM